MAILYVAKDGNDGNSGASWALAKLTIAGAISAAVSGDTIQIASGVYAENLSVNKLLTFQGVGRPIVEGPGGAGTLFGNAGNVSFNVHDLVLRNAALGVQGWNSSFTVNALRCVFRNLTTGAAAVGNGFGISSVFAFCSFEQCSAAISGGVLGVLRNCTLIDCTTGIAGTSCERVENCLFYAQNVPGIKHWSLGAGHPVWSDYNVFNAVDANRQINTSTSLAAWQAASGKDARSSVVASPFADYSNGIYHLPLTSTLARLGYQGTYVGAYPPALVLSPAVNAASWNAPALSTGLEQDGSGYWVLSAPGSAAWRSPVLDLGASRVLRRLIPVHSLSAPGSVLDYQTADSGPRQWSFRWRGSNVAFAAADASPAWTEANLDTDVLAAYRYLQLEYTLRTDGV